jgi:hypothetical protein
MLGFDEAFGKLERLFFSVWTSQSMRYTALMRKVTNTLQTITTEQNNNAACRCAKDSNSGAPSWPFCSTTSLVAVSFGWCSIQKVSEQSGEYRLS